MDSGKKKDFCVIVADYKSTLYSFLPLVAQCRIVVMSGPHFIILFSASYMCVRRNTHSCW